MVESTMTNMVVAIIMRAFILIYLSSFTSADIVRGDDFKAEFSVINEGRLYSFSILMVKENVDWRECAFTCIRFLQCVTFNYNSDLGGICELLDSEFDEDERDDKSSKGWYNFGTPKAVHGGFSHWRDADVCTVTCGGGTTRSYRTCTQPSPKHGGNQCSGEQYRSVRCNIQPCPEKPLLCNMTVLGVTDITGGVGKFFFINRGVLKGLSAGGKYNFNARNARTQVEGKVAVWGKSERYPTFDGHGRFLSNPTTGQFQIGDRLTILDETYCTSAKCEWILQKDELCFGAKDDQYGSFTASHNGNISAVRLAYIKGKVYCTPDLSSYWGCPYDDESATKLAVIVTDQNKQAIFPPEYNTVPRPYFYKIPGIHSNNEELDLFFPDAGIIAIQDEELQVWFVEDLFETNEDDNGNSKTCAKVYAKYNCD